MLHSQVMESVVTRIEKDLLPLAKIEAVKDGKTLTAWLSELIRKELKRRKVVGSH